MALLVKLKTRERTLTGARYDRDDVDHTHHGVLHVNYWLAVLRRPAYSQAGPVLRTVHGGRHLQLSAAGPHCIILSSKTGSIRE